MSEDPEILVHISAPGGVGDDNHYRRLASAYLAFKPSERQYLLKTIEPHGTRQRALESDSWHTPPAVLPDSQPSTSSQDQCISSSFSPSNTFIPDDELRSSASDLVDQISSTPALQQADCQKNSNAKPCRIEHLEGTSSSQIEECGNVPNRSIATLPVASAAKNEASRNNPDSFYARPPPPATSTKPFTTHITRHLATLAERISIDKHFQPSFTARPLRNLERGHWVLRMPESIISSERFSTFWRFLEKCITEGRVGWGVWAERKVDMDKGPDLEDKVNVVHVYCWGEVVGHVYLVFMLGINRSITKLDARWVDGAGQTVIEMPKRL